MLNKKILRKFAADNPAPGIPPGHGLLHAEQVKYIVRTAVKIIGHHRILVLYIYSCERILSGDSRPIWTMFQMGTSDYITLARKDDVITTWRAACFERLGNDYNFASKCAFYSQNDETCVSRYLHDTDTGFLALCKAQSKIQSARLRQRQQQKDRLILARMEPLKALPCGLKAWVRRSVMPVYLFYDTNRKKIASGRCSACGKPVTLLGAKHNAKTVCPHCKRELTLKSRGRRGCVHNRDTCQVVQTISGNEVVVRIVKVSYDYYNDSPVESFWENARIFVRLDEKGQVCCDSFYYSYGDYELTPWRHGERPVYCRYSYNFEADTCGHVYCANLPAALAGTPWQYCPIMPFYEHYHEQMQLAPFLAAHIEHPRFEHLVKAGFYNIASDLAYRNHDMSTLNETQNRTHRILIIAPEDVGFLRDMGVGLSTLRGFQKHSQEGLKDRQELFLWAKEHKVANDIDKILPYMTVHKLLRYMDKQYSFLCMRKTRYGAVRYRDMQALVSEYRDYLEMCVKEQYDMGNNFVLYPKDLQKAHDGVARRVKHKADVQMRRDFEAVYRRVSNQMDFQHNGLKIIYPSTPEDIVAEGNALHHCVGGYVDRVAKKECMILFLRRCEDVTVPYYTIEVRNKQVTQVRGMNNGEATPEVKDFIAKWTHEVLQAAS